MTMHKSTVKVKEQEWIPTSKANKEIFEGLSKEEVQNKQVKKFSLNSFIKDKDLNKDLNKNSNYFDESHDGFEINASGITKDLDFRIPKIEAFDIFQVKTFLFDRNLNQRIGSGNSKVKAV